MCNKISDHALTQYGDQLLCCSVDICNGTVELEVYRYFIPNYFLNHRF